MPVILQGELRVFPPTQLLPFLAEHGHSGTLICEVSSSSTRVFVHHGKIAWAEADAGALGVEEAVLDVLGAQEGSFTFLEETALPAGQESLDLEMQPLVDEAVRRADEARRILDLYPDDRVTFRVADNPSDQINLTPEEFKLVFRIGRGQTLGDLCRELGRTPSDLYPVIHRLEENGLIASVPSGGASAPAPAPPAPAAAPKPSVAPRAAAQPAPPAEPRPAKPAAPPPAAKGASSGKPPGAPQPGSPEPAAAPARGAAKSRSNEAPTLAGEGEAARIPAPPVSQKTLVGTLVGEAGTDVMHPLVTDEIIVGRETTNAVVIQEGSISNRHARIFRTPEGFMVEDLKSRNGTFVNGEPVKEKRLLADNDEVRFGRVLMTFHTAKEIQSGEQTLGDKVR